MLPPQVKLFYTFARKICGRIRIKQENLMPTELSVNSICQIVSEEKFGFRFGKPDRPSAESLSCILPILRETAQVRQYITYSETDKVLAHDSGSINKVNLLNSSKSNVFLRSGTIFEGKGTQSRALTRSAVLFPGQAVALDVRCVHQSHGIRSGSGFEYGGITPLSVDSAFYTSGYTPGDQHTMWDSVTATSNMMRSASGDVTEPISGRVETSTFGRSIPTPRNWRTPHARTTPTASRGMRSLMASGGLVGERAPESFIPQSDNLKKNFDEFAKNFDDVLSKARLHDNQVGLGLITDKGCKTVELFDLAASWESIHKDSVKRMGTELLRGADNTNVFEYRPENAINAVRAVLALPFKSNVIYQHKPSNGEPPVSIYGLTAQRYVGEVVELDGRVIHLVILESN
jgi:hypothetical protein